MNRFVLIALALLSVYGGAIAQNTSGTGPLWIPSDPLSIVISSGNMLVTIHPDGTIEYGKDYTPDDAAKASWDAVSIERKARNCQ